LINLKEYFISKKRILFWNEARSISLAWTSELRALDMSNSEHILAFQLAGCSSTQELEHFKVNTKLNK
jgi:hypothetical protein